MRHIKLALFAGLATFAAAIVFSPDEAEARYGYRGGYGSRYGGYGYRRGYNRPYTTNYRPYRYYGYDPYPRGYRPYIYIPPTVGPSAYGYPGMIGPRPQVMNPGYYGF